MKKLRTAVVGLGRIGWNFHIPQIINHEGFELVAVADPMDERLNEARIKLGVKGYKDYTELLLAEKLDLVVLAAPTHLHGEQAIAAFKQGIDVFLEKPMAPSLEEADRIIDDSRKYGCKLMVYQPRRAGIDTQAIKQVLERNLIGPVYMIKRGVSLYVRRNDWQSQKKFGGGMLNNYGSHYIDQLLYLASSKVKSVSCECRKIASLGDADDVVKALMVTENDIILDLDINMAAALPLEPWVILGKYGTIVFEYRPEDKSVLKVKYLKPEELGELSVDTHLAAPGRTYDNNDHIRWYEDEVIVADYAPIDFYGKCYEFYALGGEPFVKLEETREVMRVINECRKRSLFGIDAGN